MFLALVLLPTTSFIELDYIISSFKGDNIFYKDFIQDWLLGKAIVVGIDPYLSIHDLAVRLIGNVHQIQGGIHPTPHPPTAGLFLTPLSCLAYRHAAYAWFFLELLFVTSSIYLVCRTLGFNRPRMVAVAAVPFALIWGASGEEIALGQLVILQLLFLSAAWFCISRKLEIRTGMLTGLAIILKPMLWPLIFFFALKKQFKALLSCVALLISAGSICSFILGVRAVYNYVVHILPTVDKNYACSIFNISLRSAGLKLFKGTYSTVNNAVSAPPVINIPMFAEPAGLILPLVCLIVTFYLIYRMEAVSGFSLMIISCILASPVAWGHYFALLAIPVGWVVKALMTEHSSAGKLSSYALWGVALFPGSMFWYRCVVVFSGDIPTGTHAVTVPGGLVYLMFIPTAASILLFPILWRLQGQNHPT